VCVFRGDPATCTDSIRPPIPIWSGQGFRGIRPPPFGQCLSCCEAIC